MKSPMNRALLAALAFGLASGPVSAAINLSPASGTAFAPYKYAKETLSSATSNTATHDGVTYYTLTSQSDEMDITFNGGPLITAATDTGLLYITLTGMAFSETISVGGFTVASGGGAGDTTALLRATSDLAANATVTIDIGSSNQMLMTSDHKGGITVELVNATLEGILGSGKARVKHMREGAVVGAAGITTKVKGSNPTATVVTDFMAFSSDETDKTASLGSVEIALAAADGAHNATSGGDVVRSNIYLVATSMLKLKGDLSFASAVAAHAGADAATCGDTSPLVLAIAEDKMSASVAIADNFGADNDNTNSMRHICITAKDDTAIPKGDYTIDVDYARATGTFVSPIADVTDAEFGSIMRDGTTINIPFVTTHPKYTHRFMIVNNGAPTTYEFTFTSEDGTTATAGTMASGDLPKGMTPLKAADIVSLTGGNRTAATFTAVARKTSIEMSSVLVTKETGATDLTVLMAE